MVQSVVTEVLATAGSLHREILDERVQNLEKKIVDTKAEILELVRNRYSDLVQSSLVSAREIIERQKKLSLEIEAESRRIQNEIDSQPRITAAEVQNAKSRLEEINNCICALSELCEVGSLCEDYDVAVDSGMCSVEANLRLIREKLQTIELRHSHIVSSEIQRTIRAEYCIRETILIDRMREIWRQTIRWDSRTSPISCSLTIFVTPGDVKESPRTVPGAVIETKNFIEVINAMASLGVLQNMLSAFSQYLLKNVLLPLARGTSKLQKKSNGLSDGSSVITVVEISYKSSSSNSVTKPKPRRNPQDVYADLDQLFEFMDTIFDFDVTVAEQNRRFLSLVGDQIAPSLLEALTQDCLKPAIPAEDGVEQSKFEQLMSEAGNFINSLKGIGFLPEDSKSVVEYAADFDMLFIDKKCGGILAKARSLIMHESHTTTIAPPWSPSSNSETTDLSATVSGEQSACGPQALRFDDQEVLQPVMQFPPCLISVSVVDLLKLISTTLEQAIKAANPSVGARLIQTARNICELFVDLLPMHFRNMDSLPRFSAVFYNNCMYLAHHLTTVGLSYFPQVQRELLLPQGFPLTFIDFYPRLRQLAVECLDRQLQKHRLHLEETLKSANDFLNASESDAQYEIVLHKCSSILSQLHKEWKDVLVPSLLLRLLGHQVQFLLRSVSDSVVKMEDISSDDAKQLVLLFEAFLEKVEVIFKVENGSGVSEIRRFCEMEHHRFKELLLVLEGSLQDITDRWCDGKGPLAVAFSPAEVKSLIRALFQNTERRAQALAQIKLS